MSADGEAPMHRLNARAMCVRVVSGLWDDCAYSLWFRGMIVERSYGMCTFGRLMCMGGFLNS